MSADADSGIRIHNPSGESDGTPAHVHDKSRRLEKLEKITFSRCRKVGQRIDFATRLDGDPGDSDQPSEFKSLVEERRIVESITGNENLEIQWRLATLNEAKAVVAQYRKYLLEHSLIKSVFDETVSLPPPKKIQKIQDSPAA